MHSHLRPQMPPQPLMPALSQQVQVELPERRPIPVGIIDHDHDTIWITRLQPVIRGPRPLHHPGEQPCGMHAAHFDPSLTGEEDHADGVRTPPADHHTVTALTIKRRVSA